MRYLIILLLISQTAFSASMLPLEKYMQKNKNYSEDLTITLYLSDRCAGLNLFMAKVLKTNKKGLELSEKSQSMATVFMMLSNKLLISEFNKNSKDAASIVMESVENKMKDYLKDGKDWQSKTGSYFVDSYIEKDLKICDTLFNSLANK